MKLERADQEIKYRTPHGHTIGEHNAHFVFLLFSSTRLRRSHGLGHTAQLFRNLRDWLTPSTGSEDYGLVAGSIMSEYYKAKLNKRYLTTILTGFTSHTCLSLMTLSSDPSFGEGPSVLSKRISEGPSSTLPLPDLDIGCDLVDRE